MPPVSEHRIIGLAGIARLLKRPDKQVAELAETVAGFPIPVAYIEGHRAWLYEDALLFKRGLSAPERDEGELQHLFADAEELRARLALLPDAFSSALRRHRWDGTPRPEGALVRGVYYWKREQVQHWLKGVARTHAMAVSLRAGLRNR